MFFGPNEVYVRVYNLQLNDRFCLESPYKNIDVYKEIFLT